METKKEIIKEEEIKEEEIKQEEIKQENVDENLQDFQGFPNSYFCHLCPSKFEDYSMLKVHLFFAHGGHANKNKTEPKTMEKSNSISEEKFLCEICGTNIGSKSNLKVHVAKFHRGTKRINSKISSTNNTEGNSSASITPEEKMTFSCEICLKEFKTNYHMKRHTQVHDKKNSKLLLDIENGKFEAKENLNGSTANEEMRSFKCEVCGMKFGKLSDVNLHALVHVEKIPWKCYTCNETFEEKKSLKQHTVLVHGKKSHCEKCGAGFDSIGYLSSHISTVHEKKKPFQCDLCGSSWGRKDNLKGHIAQVHNGIKRKHLKRNNS